jgi:tetratricopeptide (TPR) repeat protein
LRALERYLLELDTRHSTPMQHLEAYYSCEQYLAQIGETLSRTTIEVDVRAALRAGTERIRSLQKRHLLAWARKESQRITASAQRHASAFEQIKTAERALEVLNEALQIYPDEPKLQASAEAVREFAASVHIKRWVELAEREAFKGHYAKAIDHYRNALFDLTRADIGEDARREVAEKITREVQLLYAHRAATGATEENAAATLGDIPDDTVMPG